MAANRSISLVLLAALCFPVAAQTIGTGKTVRHRKVGDDAGVSALVREAEADIDKKDFAAAEPKLQKATSADAKDYRAWFDLGYVYSATDRKPKAIEAYQKSVELKPDAFESNVNLGVLLAATGDPQAEKYLRAATKLKPALSKPNEALERAWVALAMFLQDRDPAEARKAYEEAARLVPSDPEPHFEVATLAEKAGDFAAAEKEFGAASRLDPKSEQAVAGLANIYMRTKRLPEAESALKKYIGMEPNSVNAHLQLGRVLRELGRAEEASAEFAAAAKLAPNDTGVLKELADQEISAGRYPQAETRLVDLVQRDPRDAELQQSLGTVLLKQRKFPEAEQQFIAALKLKADLPEAYGNLAIAAAENKHYELAIKALEVRTRYLADTPATYFLRATSYDNMQAYTEAVDFYRKFLDVAGGKYPDQEWQARHRLIAIEPMAKKKKK